MDPLRQALALQIGTLTLDVIEARTSLADMTKQRDSALRQCNVLRDEMARMQDKRPAKVEPA